MIATDLGTKILTLNTPNLSAILQQANGIAETKSDELEARVGALTLKKENSLERIASLSQQLAMMESQNALLTREISLLKTNIQTLKQTIEMLEISGNEERRKAEEQMNKRIDSHSAAIKIATAAGKAKEVAFEQQIATLQRTIQAKDVQIGQLDSQLSSTKTELSKVQTTAQNSVSYYQKRLEGYKAHVLYHTGLTLKNFQEKKEYYRLHAQINSNNPRFLGYEGGFRLAIEEAEYLKTILLNY